MENIVFNIAVGLPGFLLAIVCHEAAHAYMALRFGDSTAKMSGRLTLNPASHVDVLGTIIFPLVGAFMGGVMFGWAKPVPVNVRHFKNIRRGIFWVSFAGPLMNIILGSISAFLYALVVTQTSPDFYLYDPFRLMLVNSMQINFILAAFNLIPFPPLDGSKMVTSFLNHENMIRYESLARYSFLFFIFLLFTRAIHYILLPGLIFGEYLKNIFIHLLSF